MRYYGVERETMDNMSKRSVLRVVQFGFAAILLLGVALLVSAGGKVDGVTHTPVMAQALPGDPGRTLTAVVVELPPGAGSPSHHHSGIVFAYVLEGNVCSQLDDGKISCYHPGKFWVEPPGTRHTLTQNPSRRNPARLLAVFVAPTGSKLTTYDR